MKRKNSNRLIIYSLLCVISLLFMSNSCGEDFTIQTYRVTFENQSGDTIYYAAFNYIPSNGSKYCHYDLEESDIIHVLKNGEQDGYIEAIRDEYICVLVFKKETMRKYGKDELVKNKIFDKRYLLTYDELRPKGFKIIHTAENQLN